MKTEDKTKLILFIRQQLSYYDDNHELAWEAIFGNRLYGNKKEKLAVLKFLALHSSSTSQQMKNSALGVIAKDGTPVNAIDMEIMIRKE
jgi:hypothetical protein